MTQNEIELAVLLRARYPYIYIDTYEEMRVVESILKINRDYTWQHNGQAATLDRKIYSWSLTEGIRCLTSEKSGAQSVDFIRKNANEALNVLEYIAKKSEHAIFILKDFHPFLREHDRRFSSEVVRKLRDLLPALRVSEFSKSVIFISPVLAIPDEMKKEITVFDYPLPSEEEILSIFEALIQDNHLAQTLSDAEMREIARSALGMTALEAENAFCRAIIKKGCLSMEALETIFEEKKQCIRKSGLLDYVESDVKPSDVGGLDVLKEWLNKRKNSWGRQADQYCLPAPKGVLITGIPGCGKSLVAKTMSSIWGVPLIQLDMGRIYSGLVGSSEENMRKAIRTAEAMAPCVLWLDEIEKGLAGTGSANDSGTSSRVFGTLLTWMQEKKTMVFILATSNDISAMKPELLRKGRFDEIFFVDAPTLKEREAILRVHIKKHMCPAFSKLSLNDRFYGNLAKATDGFVGSELESLVTAALFEAYANDRNVEEEDFYRAVENTVPLSKTQGDQIRAMREWAGTRAVSATSMSYRSGQRDQAAGRFLHL